MCVGWGEGGKPAPRRDGFSGRNPDGGQDYSVVAVPAERSLEGKTQKAGKKRKPESRTLLTTGHLTTARARI